MAVVIPDISDNRGQLQLIVAASVALTLSVEDVSGV